MDLMGFDVQIVGGGPAGRALARACAQEGLETAIVDRHPHRPPTATYGAWADELPPDTPTKAVSTTVRAYAREEHLIARTYVVLDNARLHEIPDDVTVLQHPAEARYTFNATGARKGRAEQTAVGTVIESDSTETTLMDWRNGDTFLYTVPLGDNQVLVEETCLARRPGMPLAELRQRLHNRLQTAARERNVSASPSTHHEPKASRSARPPASSTPRPATAWPPLSRSPPESPRRSRPTRTHST